MKLEDVIREALSLGTDVELPDSTGPGQIPAWDSLGHVTIMAAIEQKYNVSLELDEVMQIQSIADIRTVLTGKGVSGS